MEATEQEIGQLMDCLHGLFFGLQGAQRLRRSNFEIPNHQVTP
jgi:hypothetical protein